jgi:pimeloyl-ACP methyl ester carboxylesterase
MGGGVAIGLVAFTLRGTRETPCEGDMASADDVRALDERRRTVVTNDGARLSVIDVGEGPPLVILPAWSNAAIEYRHQIVEFARDHRVIAVDMRGHGESEKVECGYRVSRLAADLEGVLAELDVREATLIGHSMGCSVIWAHHDLYGPQRTAALVLVDQPATQLIQPWWSERERLKFGCNQTPEDLLDLCARLAGSDGAQERQALFTSVFSPGFPRSELEPILTEIARMPARHAASLMLDHATRDWRDVIGRIRLPTLVVGGRASLFSVESQAWIAEQIPGAHLEIFEQDEGGSHFMIMENPGRFSSVVREFLSA